MDHHSHHTNEPRRRGGPRHQPPFGRGPMPGGPFGRGRGRRRRGDIRAAVLLLLVDEPRNGYQLMQAIEELSGGRWRPSPGSVYPTLSQLEDEGLIRSTEMDGTRLFELTDSGHQQAEERQDRTPPWEDSQEPESFTDLRTQMRQLHVAARQVADAGREDQLARAAQALAAARRALYGILAEDDEPTP